MASTRPSVASPTFTAVRHLHAVGDTCPVCEQSIPHDRADEIAERLEARERQQSEALTSRMNEAFAREKAEALEGARLETAQKVEAARQEAGAVVEARLKAQVDAAAQAQAAAQAALDAKTQEYDTAQSLLRSELHEAKLDSEATIEQLKRDGAEREAAARLEATTVAQAATAELLTAAEQAKVAAEAKAQAAEAAADSLNQAHQAELTARLDEQRVALESAQTTALNAERSSAFEERQKLSNKVDELQRALEKKSNEELGEGAEIVVFEALKAEFPADKIERIVKGQAGADIRHTVLHNGRECGKIIYDSKNHNAWRNEFVTKLKADQLADRADHAVLSTHKFPAGGKQLVVQDGVVIAGPARVVAIVQMIRAHLIHAHTLRMSNDARAQKTDALYTFITSQQCADQFARLDEHAEALLKIQEREMKAHQAVWTQQGITIRAAMKVQAEMRNQIDSIIGTAPGPESEG